MIKEAEEIIDSLCEERKYKRELLGSIPRLHCQSCNREIPYNEKYVKENLLYVTSDWTKCLCSRCTTNWKRRNEIAEAYPNFGKRADYDGILDYVSLKRRKV